MKIKPNDMSIVQWIPDKSRELIAEGLKDAKGIVHWVFTVKDDKITHYINGKKITAFKLALEKTNEKS